MPPYPGLWEYHRSPAIFRDFHLQGPGLRRFMPGDGDVAANRGETESKLREPRRTGIDGEGAVAWCGWADAGDTFRHGGGGPATSTLIDAI